jgi:hippurate hydrolase
VLGAVERIATAEAAAGGAPRPPSVVVSEGTAAAVSDPEHTRRFVDGLRGALGRDALRELPPEMGSEDFGEYGRAGVPSVMLQVGVVEPARFAQARATGEALPSIHSGRFLPAPGSLELAVRVESLAALDFLARPAR